MRPHNAAERNKTILFRINIFFKFILKTKKIERIRMIRDQILRKSFIRKKSENISQFIHSFTINKTKIR